MRIALITEPGDVIHPKDNGGGASISMGTYQMARYFSKMNNDVIIFSKLVQPLPEEEMDARGIFHHRINLAFEDKLMRLFHMTDRIRFHLLRKVKYPLWASSFYYSGFLRQIGSYLEKWNPDVVHLNDYPQFVPMLRRLLPNARIVLHARCEWLSQLDPRVVRRSLQQVDLVIGVSEYITQKICQRFPEFSDRCKTIHNAVDLSQFSPREDLDSKKKNSRILLFVGRISPEKGVHVLLEAFRIVLKKFPDARLQIVGKIGSALPQEHIALSDDKLVQDLARFYNFPPARPDFYYSRLLTMLPADEMQKVSFLASMPYTGMQDVYRNADIFINTSVWGEPFGRPVIEAMASGLPVIASDGGGIPEIVSHGETGLLVQPGNPAHLAESIIQLLEDEELRQNLRIRAMQEIEGKFSAETLSNEILCQYQSLLSTTSLSHA